ncbi:MBL fold metallo-hydrolase [Nocardiopsis chromatogenes]|uniref:MBL fold metallo-hydrolase n=1 Tax=Nocardiopsis chromatogenes TaxID=280239 RepID=UPI00034494B8|nr:MBL fold metallo-hydrolase [Nocardiopsis chromatogenes]
MFWKRKGKKKGTGEAEEASAVAIDESADEKEASDEEAGSDVKTADKADQADEDGAQGGEDGEAAGEKPAGKSAEEPTDTEDSEGSEEKEPEKKAAADEDDSGEQAGKRSESGKDTDGDSEDGDPSSESEAGAGSEAAGADGEEAEDDEDESESEDESDDEPVAKKRREIEPEEPGIDEPDDDGVQRVRTAGTLEVDGEEYKVVNNTWVVKADDEGVIVIDPAHDAEAVMEAVGDREVYLVACTNGYNTHIGAAVKVAERDEAPIALHRRELRPWRKVHGAEHPPEIEIEAGGSFSAGDLEIDVLGLPGTSSGSVGYYISQIGAVFSGDTLLAGELGTVGEGYIDYTRQLHSVGEVLLSLPPDTRVLPDRGPETTVEEESGNFDSWV